ncbi:hypothetical protein F5X96DRAFT_666249 [Biscogniauxia mediterranea]|nr:hypothetical protein F5X96DRAFT_666249 [Biscogniauxia mediterranea]
MTLQPGLGSIDPSHKLTSSKPVALLTNPLSQINIDISLSFPGLVVVVIGLAFGSFLLEISLIMFSMSRFVPQDAAISTPHTTRLYDLAPRRHSPNTRQLGHAPYGQHSPPQ